jgi:protein-S-isoprenylcysteine O-methyltransferase Ste14
MQANPLPFRLRFLAFLAIYALGFVAPWNLVHRIDTQRDAWSWLMMTTSMHTPMHVGSAAVLYLSLGILCTLAAALLRTWGSAYLGAAIVHDSAMHSGAVVAAGPYRFVRNPLYLGTFLQTLALALLMSPSGAIFAIVAVALFELWLISGEELFLSTHLGQPYLDYKARVPRLLPALTPRAPASAARPAWGQAFLGELYYWGLFLTLALFGWQYNPMPLWRGALISFGLSLLGRALLPPPDNQQPLQP